VICSSCGSRTEVVDSRSSGQTIRRRRVCTGCQGRMTTYETTDKPGSRVEGEAKQIIDSLTEELKALREENVKLRKAIKRRKRNEQTPEKLAEASYRRKLQRAGVPYPDGGTTK
jgi:transcriptional regulator NrdR family protein